MRAFSIGLLVIYVELLLLAAAMGIWIPRAEQCEEYFTSPMSYVLALGWYPACKATHFEFKCPDAWQPNRLCEEK